MLDPVQPLEYETGLLFHSPITDCVWKVTGSPLTPAVSETEERGLTRSTFVVSRVVLYLTFQNVPLSAKIVFG